MIVTMTSLAPVYALSTPGIRPATAPARRAARNASRTCGSQGILAKLKPTQLAATAPRISCDWPPMLKAPERYAMDRPSAVMISGTEETIVLPMGRNALAQFADVGWVNARRNDVGSAIAP